MSEGKMNVKMIAQMQEGVTDKDGKLKEVKTRKRGETVSLDEHRAKVLLDQGLVEPADEASQQYLEDRAEEALAKLQPRRLSSAKKEDEGSEESESENATQRRGRKRG